MMGNRLKIFWTEPHLFLLKHLHQALDISEQDAPAMNFHQVIFLGWFLPRFYILRY